MVCYCLGKQLAVAALLVDPCASVQVVRGHNAYYDHKPLRMFVYKFQQDFWQGYRHAVLQKSAIDPSEYQPSVASLQNVSREEFRWMASLEIIAPACMTVCVWMRTLVNILNGCCCRSRILCRHVTRREKHSPQLSTQGRGTPRHFAEERVHPGNTWYSYTRASSVPGACAIRTPQHTRKTE